MTLHFCELLEYNIHSASWNGVKAAPAKYISCNYFHSPGARGITVRP